jgi:hypothetical protein
MDHEGIVKHITTDNTGSNGMWPMMMAMCNGGGGFGGNNGLWGLLLVLALVGRRGLFGEGAVDAAAATGISGAARDVLCSIQSSIGDLSGKLLAAQIALSDNIGALGNEMTQNINANFANTNAQLRDIGGEIRGLGASTAAGFAAAAMERCAMTSKLATDINQVGAANLAAINNTTEKMMCGFNGLNTNLYNIASNLKDQATANFTVLDKNDAAIACGVEKLSVQSACETKDIINVSNNNTQQILCAISKTNDNILLSEQRLSKQISDLNYLNQIAELQEQLRECKENSARNENIVFQNNMNRNFQIMSDSVGTQLSALRNLPIATPIAKS